MACDVRIYTIIESDELVYTKSLPRVSGCVLSVTWSLDASMLFSGSSDELIRCWNPVSGREIYRITVGLGGLGCGPELCVWSLLSLMGITGFFLLVQMVRYSDSFEFDKFKFALHVRDCL